MLRAHRGLHHRDAPLAGRDGIAGHFDSVLGPLEANDLRVSLISQIANPTRDGVAVVLYRAEVLAPGS